MEFGGKVLQTANNQLQFSVQGRFLCQRLALLLQPGETLTQASHPGLKLSLVDGTLGITVDQAGDALASLTDLAFNRAQGRTFGARPRLQATPIFLGEPLRMGQQRTDCLPDGQIQQVPPYLRIVTEPLAAKAVRVRTQAAVRGVRARFAFAGPRAQAFPIKGIATVLTLQQALQQIQGASARLPGMALVLLQLLLDCRKHLGLYECRDRDRDPVLRRDIIDRHGAAWLHGPAALGPQPGAQGALARLAKSRGALIGRMLQDTPPHTPIPDGLAGAGHFARLGEPATDLPNGPAVVAHPGKDSDGPPGLRPA